MIDSKLNLKLGRFHIDADELNYILREERMGKDKDGNPKQKIVLVGFYDKFDKVAKKIIEMGIMNSDKKGLLNICNQIKDSTKELAKSIERVAQEIK